MLQIIVIFYILLITSTANPILNDHYTNTKVCTNEQCKLAAAIMNKSMKKSVDPCDDFYEYACGGWTENYPLPQGQEVWSLDRMTEYIAAIESKEILEDEEREDDFAPLKYEKWWYKSCMNTDKIEEIDIKPMIELINYLGGWPMILNTSDWSDKNHAWQSINGYYADFKDLTPLFDIIVSGDDRNASRNVIELNKPGKTLYDMLMENGDEISITPKYTEYMKNVAKYFLVITGKTVTDDQLSQDIENTITLEKNLRLLKYSGNESKDMEPSRAYISIENLQQFYDEEREHLLNTEINWLHVITSIFRDIDNVTIDISEEIGVEDKYYLRKLSHLLKNTSNRVIVNYLHWKFISSSIKYTNKFMRDLFNSFLQNILIKSKDVETNPERWKDCIEDMRLGIGYRYEYVKRHFSEETNKMIHDMASETHSEMLDEMEHYTWLDEDTKEEALVKLHTMKWYIGNSNFFSKKEFLEHLYDGLTITPNYFENVQNTREFFIKRNLKRLRHKRNLRKYVRVDPLLTTSLYDQIRNVVAVSAAQLSVPVLHASIPMSVNYGYLAPTISQLMSQTLEKEVSPDIFVTPWSSFFGNVYRSYEIKTGCLIDQYWNHSVGPSTIDENMYDAIGLKIAFNAFQNSFNNKSIEKLPDLEELSDEQMFFISFALKHCRTASSKYLAQHDPVYYTPNEWRVIVTLSNSEEFAKAFECPVNSPMNPENKCTL